VDNEFLLDFLKFFITQYNSFINVKVKKNNQEEDLIILDFGQKHYF